MKEQQISLDVLQEKYSKNSETRDEIFARVAWALASVEKDQIAWAQIFLDALHAGFIPAGRIMSAAGTDIQATLINCLVHPVGDAIGGTDENGYPGIYDALHHAAESMRRGAGVGYDFSRIRPRGAKVRGTASSASGPISYMRVFDRSCETVESAGSRRGAQMGVMRCDHPDIFEFVHAKDLAGELNNFNISVGVTDAFMRAIEAGETWDLVHAAEPSDEQQAAGAHRREDGLWVYRTIAARELWDLIMHSTYDHAEPGVVFLDTANNTNVLKSVELLEACNPCAEQWLPKFGCCCLGSIDLTRFVDNPFNYSRAIGSDYATFDFARFSEVVRTAVRMLDNVLDLTYWPLQQQREEAMAKRRIGLGFTGLGDALIMLGLRYDTQEAQETAAKIAEVMRNVALESSVAISDEKGIPDACLIAKIYRRNSHLLSIAPTGTISLAFADNTSNGIEPAFSWTYDRKKRMADGTTQTYTVEDHAYRLYKHMFGKEPPLGTGPWVTALDISAKDHMLMLAAVQPYIDSSISKCVAKGTLIVTNQGILPIEFLGHARGDDVFGTPLHNLQVLSHNGVWRKVTAHYSGGVKPTITVRLQNGQKITGSENHQLMTHTGWTRMGKLAIGDHVFARRSVTHAVSGGKPIALITERIDPRCNTFQVPSVMTPDLALFLGMMSADGHLQARNGHISITKNDLLVGKKFTSLALSLFAMQAKHSVDRRNGVHSWTFNSKPLCAWIEKLIGYRAGDKHVPAQVLTGSAEEQIAFLSGLSLDGYRVQLGKAEWTYLYFGKSERLAREAFELLRANGMLPRLDSKKVAGHAYKAYGVRVSGVNFCLQPSKNSVAAEVRELVPLQSSEVQKAVACSDISYSMRRNWRQRGSTVARDAALLRHGVPFDQDIICQAITDIEHGEHEVFDIEVDTDHSYQIGGVMSHNTVNVPSDYPYEDFKDLYMQAWKAGLKGLATYRPNSVLGSVLSVPAAEQKPTDSLKVEEPKHDPSNPRPHSMVHFTKRPKASGGHPAWLYCAEHQGGKFAVIVTQTEEGRPFEVWVAGQGEGIRLGNLAKSLSLDMRDQPPEWIAEKISQLWDFQEPNGAFWGYVLGKDKKRLYPSPTAYLAACLRHRLHTLGVLTADGKAVAHDSQVQPDTAKQTVAAQEAALQELTEMSQRLSLYEPDAYVNPLVKYEWKACPECGYPLRKKDGCDHCSECGYIGSCG